MSDPDRGFWNEKTRQKAGFSEISKAAKTTFETLYGAGTRSRTRDLLITSQLLYQLSYTGVMGCEYIESDALVKPSCLIQLKKIDRWRFGSDAGWWWCRTFLLVWTDWSAW